jgi:peptidoglycan/LPS O-acetylase OafA/YrhL
LFNAFWFGFSRPLWCVSILILTLACYFGCLPTVNAFFSAPIWGPMANLTYGAYLTHPALIKLLAANSYDYFTYSKFDALSRSCLYFVLAYGSAVVLWCIVEKPFATLTGWLIPKARNKQQAQG